MNAITKCFICKQEVFEESLERTLICFCNHTLGIVCDNCLDLYDWKYLPENMRCPKCGRTLFALRDIMYIHRKKYGL